MNLADAIRQAAVGGPLPTPVQKPEPRDAFTRPPAPSPKQEFVDAVRSVSDEQDTTFRLEDEREVTVTADPAQAGHPVRFELFLTPEQLSGLFKGVVSAQHSVMTLRETARYLRIPGRTLEEMAQLGQIPAFLIDEKWRFSRNSVDEWLAQQSARKEMEA